MPVAGCGHAKLRDTTWLHENEIRMSFEVPGPALAPPTSRPVAQGSPAPRERVPKDWQSRLHGVQVPPPHLRKGARA